jgi:hypothetical protein
MQLEWEFATTYLIVLITNNNIFVIWILNLCYNRILKDRVIKGYRIKWRYINERWVWMKIKVKRNQGKVIVVK